MSEKNYQIVMQEGPRPGQAFDLVSKKMVIGRDVLADIVIADPEVSRLHVEVVETDTGHRLKDLGSVNGTFVNGRRLADKPIDLEPGQKINLGVTTVLRYEEAAPSSNSFLATPANSGQLQTVANNTYIFHGPVTGSAIGGGKVRAENIAGRDIIIGQAPQNLELFEEQLHALQKLLADAIAEGAISNGRDAKTIVADVKDVIAEVESAEPRSGRIKRRLEDVGDVLETTAETITKAGKAGKTIWQALPLVKQLIDAVAIIF